MGHIHLAVLPRSRRWSEVVDLLVSGADASTVAAAAARASEGDLAGASSNPAFIESVRLLAMIPQAARGDSFALGLRDLDLEVPNEPMVMDIIAAAGRVLEPAGRVSHDDFSELTRRAALAALSAHLSANLPGLFEATPSDVRLAARQLSTNAGFTLLARNFFSTLLDGTLRYWLDRTLSAHTGPGHPLADAGDRAAFDQALSLHCSESTRIIREFAGGWYGKTLHREGVITSQRAAAFGAVCLRKIGEELRERHDA